MDLPESPDDRKILRELVLQIYWDGEKDPSVCVPLGDFFGTAPGVNKYKSLPLGMTDEGLYSYWYMPFAESAVVKVTNDGEKTRTINFSITDVPLSSAGSTQNGTATLSCPKSRGATPHRIALTGQC
jgi:hypothetical protein